MMREVYLRGNTSGVELSTDAIRGWRISTSAAEIKMTSVRMPSAEIGHRIINFVDLLADSGKINCLHANKLNEGPEK